MMAIALPKRQYYTLQQAADELSKSIKDKNDHPLINVDYLLHLGAVRRIKIFAKTYLDIEVSAYSTLHKFPKKTLELANQLFSVHTPVDVFLNVFDAKLSEIEFLGKAMIYGASEGMVRQSQLAWRPVDHDRIKSLRIADILSGKEIDFGREPEMKYPDSIYVPLADAMHEMLMQYDDEYQYINKHTGLIELNDPSWIFKYKSSPDLDPAIQSGEWITKESLFIFNVDLESLIDGREQIFVDGDPNEMKNEVEIKKIKRANEHKPFTPRKRNLMLQLIQALAVVLEMTPPKQFENDAKLLIALNLCITKGLNLSLDHPHSVHREIKAKLQGQKIPNSGTISSYIKDINNMMLGRQNTN